MKKLISAISSLSLVMSALVFPLMTSAAVMTVGNDATLRPITDTASNFVIIDTNHPASATGSLNSFSYYATALNPFRFLVTDSGNVVKWVSSEITPAATGVNTFTPASSVHVESGWNVGLYFKMTGTIPFDATGTSASYTANNSGLPNVGDTLSFAGSSNRTYSFVATGETSPPTPPSVPSVPQITFPLNNAVLTSAALTQVDWTDSTGGTPPLVYQYEAYSDAGYTNLVYSSGWLTSSSIPTPGTPEGTYYVRVRAKDSLQNMSDWSNGPTNPYKFTVSNSATSTPPGPTDNGDEHEDEHESEQANNHENENNGQENHGQYVRSQENKQEAAHSRIGMPEQSHGHENGNSD